MRTRLLAFSTSVTGILATACGSAPVPRVPDGTTTSVTVQTQVVTAHEATNERTLLARGEEALMSQRWQEAIDALSTLVAANGDPAIAEKAMFDLGLAYEGGDVMDKARDTYRAFSSRFPRSPNARGAMVRLVGIHAFLEEWKELAEIGDALLARPDVTDVERISGLGARGLARIENGDDVLASRDVLAGLDLVDSLHYGAAGRLPVPAAMLRFAQAEIRRVRSERIRFVPLPPNFVVQISARAQGLLDAQAAYADAIRCVDPHWAAMSGYRIGEMYRVLHHDLMEIPPTKDANTERKKQLFFGIMHVRYRALLDKGVEMMKRTVAFAEKTGDASTWIRRAQSALDEMVLALKEEDAVLAKMPFTRDELEKALELMEKHAREKAGGS
ncbi:MAG: hypothetical protein U0169_11515 [Polyangiaceae bacterium]